MYSIIALITIGYMVNIMQIGADSSRKIMIISHLNQDIKAYISQKADEANRNSCYRRIYRTAENDVNNHCIASRGS